MVIRHPVQRPFIVAHTGHIFGQTNAIVTNVSCDVHMTAFLSSLAEVSGNILMTQYCYIRNAVTEGLLFI